MNPDRVDVVVVGSIHADLVVTLDRAPEAGETVLAADVLPAEGGKGANQAVAAAVAGVRVAMVGSVGDDPEGARAVSALRAAGVDVTDVAVVPGERTSSALVLVDRTGENRIVVLPGASGSIPSERVTHGLARRPAVVVCQGETSFTATLLAHELAVAASSRFVLNLAPVVDVPDDVLAGCDPLVLNEHELGTLLGRGTAIEGLRGRVRSAVVSRGARGASVLDAAGVVHDLPAPAVEHVVDTTGAGDVLVGTLAAALAAGRTLVDATALAVATASASVSSPGARAAGPPEEPRGR